MSTENKPGYFAILPAKVRYDETLTPNAKLLFAEITALTNSKGFCWASNRYFAQLYNVRIETVSVWISSLEKQGFITRKIIYRKGTKHILNRYIEIYGMGIVKNLNTPIDKILKDNSKPINNKNNTSLNKKKNLEKKSRGKPIT